MVFVVWGEGGLVIVCWECLCWLIIVNVVMGMVFDFLILVSGCVFFVWLLKEMVGKLIDCYFKVGKLVFDLQICVDVEMMLVKVWVDGYVGVYGYYLILGVEVVVVFVFNFKNEIIIVMLVVGVSGMFDMLFEGLVVGLLKVVVVELLGCLGYLLFKQNWGFLVE